jgi:hypothetical protein
MEMLREERTWRSQLSAWPARLGAGAQTSEPNGLARRPSVGYHASIMSEVEDVLAAALRLPAKTRAAVAAELIESLDETELLPDEVEAAWSEEIRQRLADVDAGLVTPVPWPEARRRLFAAANGRRETP